MMAVIHVVQNPLLSNRVRHEVDQTFGPGHAMTELPQLAPKRLSVSPLLSSIYAETLRLHISASIPVTPMHGELTLGKWRIPKSTYGFISAGLSHQDEHMWNTRGGSHPVESFWAERFIVDPTDPGSGPIHQRSQLPNIQIHSQGGAEQQQPYFSTDGLEGTWIPYGGKLISRCHLHRLQSISL